jgi:hypothetical protein
VAAGDRTTAVSNNGINWTTGSTGRNRTYYKVIANGNTFCTVSDAGESAISTNGLTWTRSGTGVAQQNDIAYGNGIFVSPGFLGNTCSVSSDGINWTTHTLPFSSGVYGIAFNQKTNEFCITHAVDNKCATSPDGVSWTTHILPSTQVWRNISYIKVS